MKLRPPTRLTLMATVTALAFLSGCSHKPAVKAATISQATTIKPQAASGPSLASPHTWLAYGRNPAHEASYAGPKGVAAVSWIFRVPGSVPGHMAKAQIKKIYVSMTAVRDLIGIPIGVSVADGTVYVPDDNGFLYAVNGSNGHMLWHFNARNEIMTTPLVAGHGVHKLVYVGGGNSNFSYTQAVKFGHKGAPVVRGTDISGIYAVHTQTGRLAWVYHTKGEDMPTPIITAGTLVFGGGDGHIYGLNAATGRLKWKLGITSFVSMSSATRYKNLVIMAGTHPNAVYAVNATTGKLVWHTSPVGVFSSSMGDCAPAQSQGVVVTQFEQRARGVHRAKSVEIGLNAQTGKTLWETTLGIGKVPPRNKDAVPMIAGGVVYTGSPVTASAYALDLNTGKILWHTPLKVKMKAAPSVAGKNLLYPVGNGAIFVVNRKTGKIVGKYMTHHGGFGPQNGVVIDHTFVIGSNFGWLYAVPIKTIMAKLIKTTVAKPQHP